MKTLTLTNIPDDVTMLYFVARFIEFSLAHTGKHPRFMQDAEISTLWQEWLKHDQDQRDKAQEAMASTSGIY